MSGWKTFVFNAFITGVAALETMDWTNVVDGETAPLVIGAISLANMLLRAYTKTPIFKK